VICREFMTKRYRPKRTRYNHDCHLFGLLDSINIRKPSLVEVPGSCPTTRAESVLILTDENFENKPQPAHRPLAAEMVRYELE
jgi:hypothetical protein